jgi:hypothetical protein
VLAALNQIWDDPGDNANRDGEAHAAVYAAGAVSLDLGIYTDYLAFQV